MKQKDCNSKFSIIQTCHKPYGGNFFQEMEIFSEEWKLLPALKIKFRSCSTITMSRPRHKYNKLRGHEHET